MMQPRAITVLTASATTSRVDGLVSRRPYRERPLRHEYHLTAKGEAFFPVILALRQWGETWVKSPKEGLSVTYTHASCGQPAGLGTACEHCGRPLRRQDLIVAMNPAYRREREARLEASRASR